ncbi:MAG: class I SAM-dependent methyltransferase [Bacillota bacterium]
MSDLQGPAGNYYDKYNSKNPIAAALVRSFLEQTRQILTRVAPTSIFDAGCGEGHVTARFAQWFPSAEITGADVDPGVVAQAQQLHKSIPFQVASIYRVPFADRSFDLTVAMEVLEHLERPDQAMNELVRLARRYVLLSVPNEPIWRMANMARGAYLSQWGNTPGHINHWSSGAFIRFVQRWGTVEAVAKPFPWTIVLLRI